MCLHKRLQLPFLSFLITISIIACVDKGQPSQKSESIKIRESAEPSSINPFYIRDEVGFYIAGQIFQPLLAIDYESEELVGVLAANRPTITSSDLWGMIIEYQLKKGAQFSDGKPLGVKDIIYSLKANICPLLNPYYSSYYQFIDSVSIDDRDSSKFTFYTRETYFLSEFTSGDYYILSEDQFDPKKLLRNYSLTDLKSINDVSVDSVLAQYSDFIKAFNFKDSINPIGSGAYSLEEWSASERIQLELKQKWWGNEYQSSNTYFKANATALDFFFVEDETTAINALKNGEFDIMRGIPAKNYHDLLSNSVFQEKYSLQSTSKFGLQYLGFNLANEHLASLQLRKAIAYTLAQKEIIDQLYYGLAMEASSFEEKNSRNVRVNNYEVNIDSAKYYMQLFLDETKSTETELELNFAYNAGNESRKAIGLILKESLKQINIDLSIQQYEWATYLQKLRAGEFDLFINGMSTSSFTPDLSNSFHSNAINGGKNYFSFSDSISDKLLDSIARELNDEKRGLLFEKLDIRINQEIPLLILMRPMEQIALSNELKNAKAYRLRPSYWAAEMSK